MIKEILKILAIFIIGMVGGIFAEEIFWPYFVERPLFYQYRLEKNPIYVTERKEIYIQENTALKDSISKVESSVFLVRTKTKDGKILEGSGLILTSEGLAITLADLVPQGSNFSFFVEGELTNFEILKRDLKENLALIKFEKKNLKTVGFANFEKLKIGERIFLVGKILEDGKVKTIANEGIVKNFDEEKIETNIFESKNLSGSPLFNIEGNVLGINYLTKEGKVISIPVTKIRSFANL
jgi:S1-C subfamily serine protease